jgi:hypothetical protein
MSLLSCTYLDTASLNSVCSIRTLIYFCCALYNNYPYRYQWPSHDDSHTRSSQPGSKPPHEIESSCKAFPYSKTDTISPVVLFPMRLNAVSWSLATPLA